MSISKSRLRLAISVSAILLLVTAFVPAMNISHAAPVPITQAKSGLVKADSLTTGNTSYWYFGGDASSQPGATYTYSEDAQGLHIGAKAGLPMQWAGYYAESPNTTAYLFHAFINLPYTSMPSGESYNTGIYVQTWDTTYINYIGCLAVAWDQGPFYWTVVQSFGPLVGAATITTLYQSTGAMPLAEDCTIITNGNNYLRVYLGGNMVVNRNDLNLQMPSPFNTYIEVQTTSTSAMRMGTYTNYYAALDEKITVTGASPGGTAQIVGPSNTILVSNKTDSNGVATLEVAPYNLPLRANITVRDSAGTLVAATSSTLTIWSGDSYTVNGPLPPPPPPPAVKPITQTQSGGVSYDTLTTGNTKSWAFGGSAPGQGAPYTSSEDSQGLHLGVQAKVSGQWAGYYAVSQKTAATLFHAVLTQPYTLVSDGGFNTGLYVQTSDTNWINYVGCIGGASNTGYYWTIVQAYGAVLTAPIITTLYFKANTNQPLTQDCTIITDGNSHLKVYLGGQVVVNRSNMTLDMTSPFIAFLEVQTSSAASMHTATYLSYYATTSEGLTVTNAPAGGTAEMVDSTGKVIASSTVTSGTATFLVGMYPLPLTAYVKVVDSSNKVIASTASAVTIWGGDVYAVSP